MSGCKSYRLSLIYHCIFRLKETVLWIQNLSSHKEPEQHGWYSDWERGCRTEKSNLWQGKLIVSSTKHPYWVWGLPYLLLYGYWGALFCEVKLLGQGAVHPPPFMPSSRMSTAIPSHNNIVNIEHFIGTKCTVQYTHTHTHKTTRILFMTITMWHDRKITVALFNKR